MKRTYTYRGFSVVVQADPAFGAPRTATLTSPEGFYAVVYIATAQGAPIIAPVRLTRYGEQPFATEADALMAGHSAGQRLIEDVVQSEHDD